VIFFCMRSDCDGGVCTAVCGIWRRDVWYTVNDASWFFIFRLS